MYTLKALCETIGVSGYEEPVRTQIEKLISKNDAVKVKKDRIGNLICHVAGKKISPKIMILAHMDEVGFQVMDCDASGNAKLKTLGNIKTWNTLHQRLSTSDGLKKGIMICNDPEGIKPFEFEKIHLIPTKGQLQIGDVFSFETHFIETESKFIGKALDNRISCYLLSKILEKSFKPYSCIDFVFSVQEEIGMRGSRVAIAELLPDIIFDVDTSPVGERNSLQMNHGVGIKISDSIGVSSPALVKYLEGIALSKGISFQHEVSDCGTSELIITNEKDIGSDRVGISIPCQNIHTSTTIIDKSDVISSEQLLRAIIESDFSNIL